MPIPAGRKAGRRAHHAPTGAKPLLGFGPIGWLLLAPLSALLVVALTGYDLRYAIQRGVNEIWGWDGLVFFTLNVVFAHAWASWFWPPLPHFGLISACLVLLGLQLHPRRAGAARAWAIGLLGAAVPILVFRLHHRHPLFFIWEDDARFAVSRLITGTMVATAIWLATRSGGVGLLGAGVLLAPAGLDWLSYTVNAGELPASLGGPIETARYWSGIAMNVGLAALLWTWGIRGRLSQRAAHACQGCGYDLRGLSGGVCPECGRDPLLPARSGASGAGSTPGGGPA